jgi:hypothetical protein
MTIWRMRIAFWIPKATNIHSEYVILIDFLLQQWMHELASTLRYTYIVCLVYYFSQVCTYYRTLCHYISLQILLL